MEHDKLEDYQLEEDISVHIFTASAAMVGVCLTVIGLVRVFITIKRVDRWRMIFWPSRRLFFSPRVYYPIGP